MKVICPYCSKNALYVDSNEIYGNALKIKRHGDCVKYVESYGMMYWCPDCDARVGVHIGTDKPLGTLANAGLREWRKKAHTAIRRIEVEIGRKKTYCWIQRMMDLSSNNAHIGKFNEEQCARVITLAEQWKEKYSQTYK